jgi:hypothetical protein
MVMDSIDRSNPAADNGMCPQADPAGFQLLQ